MVIKNEIREEYDFQESRIDEFSYIYRVSDEQTFIKFEANGENLMSIQHL